MLKWNKFGMKIAYGFLARKLHVFFVMRIG